MADASEDKDFKPELLVEVSPEMLRAGIEALREVSLATDLREIVSAVYMAMEYEKREPDPYSGSKRASSINDVR